MHVSPKVKSTGKKQQAFLPHSVPICSGRQGFSCASLNPSCCRLVSGKQQGSLWPDFPKLEPKGTAALPPGKSGHFYIWCHVVHLEKYNQPNVNSFLFHWMTCSNFEKVLWTAWESQWLQALLVLWEEKMLKHSPKASSSAPAYCRTSCCMSHWCSSFVFCRNAVTVGYLHTRYNSMKMHHDSTSLSPWICFN